MDMNAQECGQSLLPAVRAQRFELSVCTSLAQPRKLSESELERRQCLCYILRR
jgi:hypothetical protein